MGPIVTLTTDFSTKDGYVAAMKGVVLARCSHARIIDVTHSIVAQNVENAAWVLRQFVDYFPRESIHLAVVDPGVGTARSPILLQINHQRIIAPDNGIASWIRGSEHARVWRLDRSELFVKPLSRTFHGRDIFASVAGYLAAGKKTRSAAHLSIPGSDYPGDSLQYLRPKLPV